MIVTLNDLPTAKGTLVYPLTGLWRADVVLARAAADAPVQAGQEVRLAFAEVEYRGTAVQTGPERGLWRVIAIAGRGKMGRPVKPRTYQSMDALAILRDILGEVEELDGSSSVDYAPQSWVRLAGPAYGAVAALIRAAKANWRMTPEGRVWAGVDAWSTYRLQTPVLEEGPGRVVLQLDPALTPGVVLEGYGRVLEVIHEWAPNRARTEVRYDPA